MDSAGREAAGQLGSYSYGAKNERSIADVLRDIATNIQEIVRSEIRLARVELTEEGQKFVSGARVLAIGAVVALYAVGFVLLGAMFALELVMPAWVAALILGAVLLIAAGIAVSAGLSRLKAIKAPVKTMQTVKEDALWMKEQPKS
jgi:membrane protein